MASRAASAHVRIRDDERQTLGFDVEMSPRRWTTVATLRKFIGAFLKPVVARPDLADQVALAAHELLENALKYSVSADSRVRCRVQLHPDQICLQVQNRANPAAILTLHEVFAMAQQGNALDTYLAMMERSITEDLPSQLGLARVRYETGATLRLDVNRDTVLLEAVFPIAEVKLA